MSTEEKAKKTTIKTVIEIKAGRKWVKRGMLASMGNTMITNPNLADDLAIKLGNATFESLLLGRHSPIEEYEVYVSCLVPERVHSHICRHKELSKYVATSRPDISYMVALEDGHRVLDLRFNAKRLIEICMQRLCFRAWVDTIRLMRSIVKQLIVVEPAFTKFLHPSCVWYGFCNETHPDNKCKYYSSKQAIEARRALVGTGRGEVPHLVDTSEVEVFLDTVAEPIVYGPNSCSDKIYTPEADDKCSEYLQMYFGLDEDGNRVEGSKDNSLTEDDIKRLLPNGIMPERDTVEYGESLGKLTADHNAQFDLLKFRSPASDDITLPAYIIDKFAGDHIPEGDQSLTEAMVDPTKGKVIIKRRLAKPTENWGSHKELLAEIATDTTKVDLPPYMSDPVFLDSLIKTPSKKDLDWWAAISNADEVPLTDEQQARLNEHTNIPDYLKGRLYTDEAGEVHVDFKGDVVPFKDGELGAIADTVSSAMMKIMKDSGDEVLEVEVNMGEYQELLDRVGAEPMKTPPVVGNQPLTDSVVNPEIGSDENMDAESKNPNDK